MAKRLTPSSIRVPEFAPRAEVDSALDWIFFVISGAAAVWLAYLLVQESFALGWWQIAFVVVFWVLLAYLVLPRLHSILTRIYVPDYFIGRARTSDGLLGDPINLALVGTEPQLHEVMTRAGWTLADDLSVSTGLNIVKSTVLRRSYDEAPVSPLLLFGREQDFAYQQEVGGDPGKRHHVRFWRCPPEWMLPGGRRVDWLAAGTYDKSVGFSLFTLQVTHKIDERTDDERDHIVSTVTAANRSVRVSVIEDFSTGYHSRNGGGDTIITDGDLPIVDLRKVRTPRGARGETPTDSRTRRPAPIVVGTLFLLASAVGHAVIALTYLLALESVSVDMGASADLVLAILLIMLGGIALFNLLLAGLVYRGSNWARVLAMVVNTVSLGVYVANLGLGADAATLEANLIPVAVNILLLFALSSRPAMVFARSGRGA